MKTSLHLPRATTFALIAATLLSQSSILAQTFNIWNQFGSAGDLNWSSAPNWGFGRTPISTDDALFDVYGVVGTQRTVNNIVTGNLTISSLSYDPLSSTNGYHTTQINPGVTLSLAPQTGIANAIAVGEWVPLLAPSTNGFGDNDTVYATIVGTNSTLSVNGPNSTIRIEQERSGGSHMATLDMSNLSTFTANISNILLGANITFARPNGTLILAQTNTITTAAMGANIPGILLGCGGYDGSDGGIGLLTLGYANVFNVDWLAVGGHRANQTPNCLLGFGAITNGAFKLRGSGGGRAPLFSIGDSQAADNYTVIRPGVSGGLWGSSRSAVGTAEFRGSTVDIQVDSLIIGRNLTTNETTAFNTGATGVGTGTLNFDQGTIDVNKLYLGYKVGTNYGGATGTMLVNSPAATVNVNNGVTMTSRSRPNGGFNGGNATATLTVSSNAVVNVKGGDMIKGTPGQGTATLNLSYGGLLDMKPAGRATPGSVTLDNLNITSSALANASNLTASGTITLTGTTLTNWSSVLSGGTLNLNNSSTVLSISNISLSGTLNLNGGNITNGSTLTAATITGSGSIANFSNVTNSTSFLPGSTATAGTVNVGGNFSFRTNATLTFALNSATTIGGGVNSYLNVNGNLSLLSNNVFSVAPLGALAVSPASYRLVDYSGSLNLNNNFIAFANNTRYALGLDLSTPGQINLTNGGGSPVALTWKGATAIGGTNWDMSTTNWNNLSQKFFQFDPVTFDANGVTTAINTIGLLYPQSISVNDTRNYTLAGTGKISGNTGITKNGTGTLIIANTGGNDFNGNISVNTGVLQVGRADALGSTNGTTTIASGAVLDINGVDCQNPGETVFISGTGIGGSGVITNSGAQPSNNGGLRTVSLQGDATVSVNNRWDIRGGAGNSSFSGGLFLNNYTYTKTGPGKHELADTVCTMPGNLVSDGNGTLAFTRSLIDGPGTISVLTNSILQLENNSTGYVAKPIIFSGNGTLSANGSAFTLYSPVTNNAPAALTVDASVNLTLTNVLTGSGGITKLSGGSLILQAPDTCAGPTTISGGGIVLTNAGSLANTPSITMVPGTILDVSAVGGFTLGGGKALFSSGTVIGNLATSAGTTVSPASSVGSVGTLTVTGNLSLNNTTNLFQLGEDPLAIGGGVNDLVAVGGGLSLNNVNTIKITPLAGLDTTTPYTVMTYSNALSGGGSNLRVTSDNPRYNFSIVNPVTGPTNVIQVAVSGLPVTLTWRGGAGGNPNLWDFGTTSNWLNGASLDVFYTGDTVQFDDTATTGSITVNKTIQPGSMTINNSTLAYTLSGTGGMTAGGLAKEGTGSFTFANAGTNTFIDGITLDEGTLGFSPTTNITLAATLSDRGAGGGTLQKGGANTLTLSGNNTNFSGTILVSGGTLKPRNAAALGSTNGPTIVASGATLDVNGQNLGREYFTISGAGAGGVGAITNSGANQNNATYSVTLAGDTTFGGGGRWDIRGPSDLDPSFLLTAGNAYKVTKLGINQHSWVFTAVDDALGDIDVVQGIFSLEHGTVSPNTRGIGNPNNTLTIFSNAMLQLNSLEFPMIKNTMMRDGATITNQGGDNIISSGTTLNGSNYFVVGTATLSLNGMNSLSGYALDGTGHLIKNGTGILNLYGANNFSGGVIHNAGTIAIDNSFAFTANKYIQVNSAVGGGGLTGSRITLGITANSAWTIPPGVSVNLGSAGGPTAIRSGLYANKGLSEWQGPITFYQSPGSTNPGTVWMASDATNSTFTISGNMSGVLGTLSIRGDNQGIGKITGSVNYTNPVGETLLEKTGLSLWTIYTANNNFGDVLLHDGTLQLGINNACTVTGLMTIGQQNHADVLDLNGFNQQVSGLASDAAFQTNQFVANSSLSALSTLTILGTNVTSFAGTIMDGAVLWNVTNNIGGSQVGLTLAAGNTGSLALSGTNLYTGPTLLNGGTLLVDGSLSNTVVTVNSGATLGGTGVISGPVTVNSGGTIAAGDSIGTLAISNSLTLNAGSTTIAQVNPNTVANDQVVGVSTLHYGGMLVVTNILGGPLAAGTFKLFDAAAYSGGFAAIVPAQPGTGLFWDTSQLAVNGTLIIGALKFQTITILPDGNFQLTFGGQSGQPYRVWASDDLSVQPIIGGWTLLTSGTFGSAPVTVADLQATNHVHRFYAISNP